MAAFFRTYWMPVFGWPCLVGAGVLWGVGSSGVAPQAGVPAWYWGLVFYNYAALPLTTLIMLVAFALAAIWIPHTLRRLPNKRYNHWAMLAAAAGLLLACWASLPRAFTSYWHLASATLNQQVYHLGLSLFADGSDHCVLCACAVSGQTCTCRNLTEVRLTMLAAPPVLLADSATQTLSIQVQGQTLYQTSP
jgi:hypothetical protein